MMPHSPARNNVASKGCSVLAQLPENEARDFSFTNINISTSITRARRALQHRLPRRPRNMSTAWGSDASSNRSLNSAAGRQLLHALDEARQREEAQAQTIAQAQQTIAQARQREEAQAQTLEQVQQTLAQAQQTIAQARQREEAQAQTLAQAQQTIVQQAQIIAQLQVDIEALQAAQQGPRRRGLLRLFSCC
ncbi:hypothetical protein Vretimale_2192 [Volvox reticuliferus]|nr:hypothetical protein Vretimale_2192 [Volvox reticuliferus]